MIKKYDNRICFIIITIFIQNFIEILYTNIVSFEILLS